MIKAKRSVRVSELFAGPVRDFSIYNNQRMIPSIVDGFKPSQRKVIFGTLKKSSSIGATGIKVSQLANYIAEISAYHHGEGSLSGAIVGMAQDFPGSNNLNYLEPMGQFGSRLSPGAGADRYIFTRMMPVFRKIFPKDDDLILEHLEDDGEKIEPKYYLPILPNVLINGADGMATGHATYILQYNPEDLKKYITNVLREKRQMVHLTPWYRGYTGTVARSKESNQVTITGKLEKVNSTTIKITELPIGVWEDNYREYLNDLVDQGVIKDYNNESSVHGWSFTLTVPRTLGYESDDTLYKIFKLTSRATENFTVWLPNGKIKCFDTAEELCDYFITFRLSKYADRRAAKLKELGEELFKLNERLRFIRYYLADNNAQKFSKRSKQEMRDTLAELKYVLIDSLIEIPLYRLTKDEIEKLINDIADVETMIKFYNDNDEKALYLIDLDALDVKDLK